MTRPPWPTLFDRCRPKLDLKGSGKPDRDGWVTARCINPANHRNGDEHESMRINTRTGGVSCMSQGCISGNLNDLAERLRVDTGSDTNYDGSPRVGTLEDLAQARKLPVDVLRDFWGVRAEQKGWLIAVDDPDAKGFQRWKRYSWGRGTKYHWQPKGCKAGDLVYNITRLDPETEDAFVAAGEPDTWALHEAGLPVVSFLAGENAAPSAKAIEKLKAQAPKLKLLRLPYDRDDAGTRGAHKVGAALLAAGLAVEIISLPDDLPEDGDVSDLWVSCDGDREAFLRRLYGCETERLEEQTSKVEQRGDDHFLISLPAEGGWTHFDFDRVARGSHKLDAELALSVDLPGVSGEAFVASLNLLSLSSRDTLRRQLDIMHPNLPWVQLVNKAIAELRHAYFDADASVDLSAIEPRSLEQRYRIGSLLPDGQPTIFFGDGSTAKTYIALVAALSVATGEELLGLPVLFDRVLVIDYETDAQTHRFRYDRLLAGAGLTWQPRLIDYWPAKGRPFVDIADAVRRKVERDRNGLIIVDSAAYACGGDPSDPEAVLRYFNALNSLGKTSLTIAHVPKDSDQDKPFGSVYWSNAARKTWNFQRAQNEGEDVIHIGLFNRKVNDGRRDRPIGIRMTFEGETGPVTVRREDVADVPELSKGLPLKQRILEALKQGAMTVDGLARETGEPSNKIRARLSDMKSEVQRVTGSDGSNTLYWGLAERRRT